MRQKIKARSAVARSDEKAPKALIVVASRFDWAARTFVDRYASAGTYLMTAEDLSRTGWQHHVGHLEQGRVVVAEHPLATQNIAAVMTRLPYVAEQELFHIVPDDRAYVAAEMTAFLMCWLTELKCPVLNRPTPNWLSGPPWQHEKWVHTAGRLGIPVVPVHHCVRASEHSNRSGHCQTGVVVTIVGRRHCGAVHEALAKQARSIADAAGVELLSVRFSGPDSGSLFLDATLWPDIAADEIGDAVFKYLQGEGDGKNDG